MKEWGIKANMKIENSWSEWQQGNISFLVPDFTSPILTLEYQPSLFIRDFLPFYGLKCSSYMVWFLSIFFMGFLIVICVCCAFFNFFNFNFFLFSLAVSRRSRGFLTSFGSCTFYGFSTKKYLSVDLILVLYHLLACDAKEFGQTLMKYFLIICRLIWY